MKFYDTHYEEYIISNKKINMHTKLEKIYKDYKKGILSTGELKKYTIEKINLFLADHQKRRNAITQKDIDKFVMKV